MAPCQNRLCYRIRPPPQTGAFSVTAAGLPAFIRRGEKQHKRKNPGPSRWRTLQEDICPALGVSGPRTPGAQLQGNRKAHARLRPVPRLPAKPGEHRGAGAQLPGRSPQSASGRAYPAFTAGRLPPRRRDERQCRSGGNTLTPAPPQLRRISLVPHICPPLADVGSSNSAPSAVSAGFFTFVFAFRPPEMPLPAGASPPMARPARLCANLSSAPCTIFGHGLVDGLHSIENTEDKLRRKQLTSLSPGVETLSFFGGF